MPGDYSFDGYIAFTLFDGYLRKCLAVCYLKQESPFGHLASGHVDY